MDHAGIIMNFNNISPVQSARIKNDFVREIERHGVRLGGEVDNPEVGTRGITLDVSQVLITFMTGGAAVALIDCMKAYLSRQEQMSIKLTSADGRSLEINATDVNSKEVVEQVKFMVERVFGAAPDGK